MGALGRRCIEPLRPAVLAALIAFVFGCSAVAGCGAARQGNRTTTSRDSLPARIRRLTNTEYDASVQVLLGTLRSPSKDLSFPPDAKQGPTNSPAGAAFTVNDAQRVDPVLADKLDAAAQALVNEARANGKLIALAPCSDPSVAGGDTCAKAFIHSFGARVYRRPLDDDETAGLLRTYHAGADGYAYADGVDLLVRVLLQAPGFLYTTELGEVGAGPSFVMTTNEIATELAYLLTSAPPDDALLAAAASGALAAPEARESEARRLLATPAGRERFVRVVREWLGISDVAHREKAQSIYPDFANVSALMEQESRAFIGEVLNSNGTLADLLNADWTIVDDQLAQVVYGLSSAGEGKRTSLAGVGRRGILNQGAFLSVFATNNGSHPVFRGVALARRIACLGIPDPGSQNIVVSLPAADPTKTTRDRFQAHATDARCAACHNAVDELGFVFENFDGMGVARASENGLPIDTHVTISVGSDFDGTYASSAELAAALAQSESVRTCFARQIFRSTAARSDATVQDAEDGFVAIWKQLPADQQVRLADVLVAFIKSPTFVQRRMP